MTTYSFVCEGERLTTVNTLIVLRCKCGKRTTLDVDGPQAQQCDHCQRPIQKIKHTAEVRFRDETAS